MRPPHWLAAFLVVLPHLLTAQVVPLAPGGGLIVLTAPSYDPNRLPSTGPFTVPFQVINTNTTSKAPSFTCATSGPVTCGTVTPSSASIPAGDTVGVTVTYSTTASTGSGWVQLTATLDIGGSASDLRNVIVAPAGKGAPVFLNPVQDVVDRGNCLTLGAGEAAGLSCGDLFVVHGMPAYRSLGKDRSLTLYYNSATATGLVLVAGRAVVPTTVAMPNNIRMDLIVAGDTEMVTYSPPTTCLSPPTVTTCGYSDPYQVVLGRGITGLATGEYAATLRQRNIYPGPDIDSTVSGRVLVVNRSASEYGRGWSLLGVEQVFKDATDSTKRVWVAGDGSIRTYYRGVPLTGAMLTQSGVGNWDATKAVDGLIGTIGWGTAMATPGAWIKVDLGTLPQVVTTVRLYLNTPSAATYDIQYSDNGTAWATALTGFRGDSGWKSASWSAVGAHRYWRLSLTNTPGSGGTVRELSFGAANNFYGAPADAPDSLVRFDSTGGKWLRRYLKHGAWVAFDTGGRHRVTANRVGHKTTFTWGTVASQLRLTAVTVPPDTGTARTYTLSWNNSTALLDSIRDPGGRKLQTVMSGGNLVKIIAPGGLDTTRFAYDARNVLVKQIFLRQAWSTKGDTAVSTYTYANNARVTRVLLQSDSLGVQFDTLKVEPWDEKGLSSLVLVDSSGLPSRVNGALAGDGDVADIWSDRFGEPRRIQQVWLNTVTRIWRDSVNTVPMLPTRIEYPHASTPGGVGSITRLAWDGRGNLREQRDSTAHLGVNGLPTTVVSYSYADPASPDGPTRVQDALGRHTDYTYTALGLTDLITDPRGHQAKFWTRTGSKLQGVVDSIGELAVPTLRQANDSEVTINQVNRFTYDSSGNLKFSTTPVGATTSFRTDAFGRPTTAQDPLGVPRQLRYDALNRLLADSQGTVAFQNIYTIDPLALCKTTYTSFVTCGATIWSGDLLSAYVKTAYWYGRAGLDSIVDPRFVKPRFAYDAQARVRREIDDYDRAKVMFYRRGGVLDSIKNRDSTVVRFAYDSAGRRIAMMFPATSWDPSEGAYVVPGDTVTYTYDLLGRMVASTNLWATIRRDYYGDGTPRYKVTALKATQVTDSLTFFYDATRARTKLFHSKVNSLSIPNVTDSVTYSYDAGGDLDTLRVWWAGESAPFNTVRRFSFVWDALGRIRQVTYPSVVHGMTVAYRYGLEGTLRRVLSDHPSGPPDDGDALTFTVRTDSVDALGRATVQTYVCEILLDPGGGACAGNPSTYTRQNSFSYRGMLTIQNTGAAFDTLKYDGSGNIKWRYHSVRGEHVYTIGNGHNRLLADTAIGGGSYMLYAWDSNGSLVGEGTNHPQSHQWRGSYYDVVGRISGYAGWAIDPMGAPTSYKAPAGCNWDPEGQFFHPCPYAPWLFLDGTNVAGTYGGGSGGGSWHVAQGPGLDFPLMAFERLLNSSNRLELFYVTDGQGRQYSVGDSLGSWSSTWNISGNRGWQWAGGTRNAQTFAPDRMGTSQENPISFFRNRAFDLNTGRYTQEDPIGVAGGVNLYSYVGNNPVAYTDPFGLKVCFKGNDKDVARLKGGTEGATNSTITLDDANCVSKVESRGDKSFDKIRGKFQGLVNADETFTVRFTRIFNSTQISKYFVDIYEKYNSLAYPANVGGKCTRDAVPWNASQIIGHELTHHYPVPATGQMDSDENNAVESENVYNRANGKDLRCAY